MTDSDTLMDLTHLSDNFPETDIEWRIGQSGVYGETDKIWATAFAYLTARAVQQKLDDVCGPWGWRNEFVEWRDQAQVCGISIWNQQRKEWITKWDGADETGFESTKGGLSNSMKRAATQWGIGRYLYNLDRTYVKTSPTRIEGWNYQAPKKDKEGNIKVPKFYWETPELPDWALPEEEKEQREKEREARKKQVAKNKKAKEEEEKKKKKKPIPGASKLPAKKFITKDQVIVLSDMIKECKIDTVEFLKYYSNLFKVEMKKLEDIETMHHETMRHALLRRNAAKSEEK
jgi:hypothetical protein